MNKFILKFASIKLNHKCFITRWIQPLCRVSRMKYFVIPLRIRTHPRGRKIVLYRNDWLSCKIWLLFCVTVITWQQPAEWWRIWAPDDWGRCRPGWRAGSLPPTAATLASRWRARGPLTAGTWGRWWPERPGSLVPLCSYDKINCIGFI